MWFAKKKKKRSVQCKAEALAKPAPFQQWEWQTCLTSKSANKHIINNVINGYAFTTMRSLPVCLTCSTLVRVHIVSWPSHIQGNLLLLFPVPLLEGVVGGRRGDTQLIPASSGSLSSFHV